MARTTPTLVAEIVHHQDGTNGPLISLTPFIRQANLLTTWLAGKDEDSELSSDMLAEIETLLAAHAYSVERDKQLSSKSTDGASGSYDGQTGFNLQATHHGQMAMTLDVTGNLTKRSLESQQGKKVATVTWLGHQDHSGDPYD